ncbi:hypothetical protein OG21DRAFT_264003 [Imleria badia]|nr:hypothetical protein OG21DRAFT_264003 [Imleria badia]
MISIQDQKSDVEPTVRDSLDDNTSDLPPAYDALSIHHSTNHARYTSTSAFPGPVAGSSSNPPDSDSSLTLPALNVDKSLPPPPPPPLPLLDDTPCSPRNASPALTQRPRARKNTSWLSLLPFVSSFSAKRVRQSVLSIVSDLVVPPSRTSNEGQRNAHEILASVAETCAEHKVSLSAILQEAFIADHTPMYWAVVNYREELLVACWYILDRYLSRLFRIFGVRVSSTRTRRCSMHFGCVVLRFIGRMVFRFRACEQKSIASDNLLLNNRPLDEIRIQQTSDQAFVVFFDIPLWQRRMKAIGQVGIEFIASRCGLSPFSPRTLPHRPRRLGNQEKARLHGTS